jgi:hypothetical protein
MITTYGRSGPPTPLIIVIAIAMVLACFLLWLGMLRYFETNEGAGSQSTVNAQEEAAQSDDLVPTFNIGPSRTPVTACQRFEVRVESALMRECPAESCDIRESLPFDEEVCVYGRAQNGDYLDAESWYVVDLNANGAFRDLVYMHESVLRAIEATPIATATRPVLPTITPTPTSPNSPTAPFSNLIPLPTVTPPPPNTRPTTTISPPPPIRPSPTLERPSF